MARSKSWTESQQPENQYTYGHYIFNSVAVGLIIVALIVLLLYFLRPKSVPETHLLTVHSKPGSRCIPYQANDTAQLLKAFSKSPTNVEDFDDQQSFETQVHGSVNDLQAKVNDIDTLIVYCSAIGEVADSKPVLRSADGQGQISIEKFLKECMDSSKAANRIVVLDCGHDFASPLNYLNDKYTMGDDFNRFVDGVEALLKGFETTDGRPLWVITSTQPGEVPLYSVNKRRTLFSLAMENALGSSPENSKSYENVGDFYQALVNFCQQNGGEAAQTPLLFQSGVGRINASDVAKTDAQNRIVRLARPERGEVEKSDEEEVASLQDPKTKLELDSLQKLWARRDTILLEKYDPNRLPVMFASKDWETSIRELAEQSIEMRTANGKITGNPSIEKFADSVWTSQAAEIQYPGFGITEKPEVLSVPDRETHDIAVAFATYYDMVYRAKYYAALFDSLSWIDASESLNRFEQELSKLNDTIIKGKRLFQDNNPRKDDKSEFNAVAKQLRDLDSDLMSRITNVCRRVESLHGMTREMAIIYLLDSPLIRMGSADDSNNDTRIGLLKLISSEASGSVLRMTKESRTKNSGLRRELYHDQLAKFCINPDPGDIANRKLDAFAYYFDVGDSYLRTLKIDERRKTYTAEITRRNQLRDGVIIDPGSPNPPSGGTLIDLGLDAKTADGLVDLSCKLEQADAPFVIYDPKNPGNFGKAIDLNDSDGKFYVLAEKVIQPGGSEQTYELSVQIKQVYKGENLSNKQTPASIRLSLPNDNRVDLIVNLKDKHDNVRVQPETEFRLSPWPNRDTPFSISVANYWHKPHKLQATLYPCVAEDDYGILPGKIDETIKQNTLRRLKSGTLPMVARSNIVVIEPGQGGRTSSPKSMELSAKAPEANPAKPAPKLLDPGTLFEHGLLCRVEDVELDNEKNAWNYWLHVFPDTSDLFELLSPRVENDQLWLKFACAPDFKNRPLKINWQLGDASGSTNLTNDGQEKLLDNVKAFLQQSRVPILYINVEGWPRRYAYIYNGLDFINPNTVVSEVFPNAVFDELSLTEKKPEQSPFQNVLSRDRGLAKVFGVKGPRPEFIYGTLQINCVINAEQFSFDGPKDVFVIDYGGIKRLYYFPHHVESTLGPNPDTGIWNLKSIVTDFVEKHEVSGNPFDVNPVKFVFNGSEQRLDADDIVRIIFNNTDPPKPNLNIFDVKVHPGQEVRFTARPIADNPGGVGTDDKAVKYQLNEMPFQSATPSRSDPDRLGFVLPKDLGIYKLRVQTADQLGNVSEIAEGSFSVVAKPEPEPEKNKKPDPVFHTLLVQVQVEGQGPLKMDQEPKLVISPAEDVKGPKRISADTFEFSNVKGGEYTITAEFQLKTPLFIFKTAGKTSWNFDNPDVTKKTRILTLKKE